MNQKDAIFYLHHREFIAIGKSLRDKKKEGGGYVSFLLNFQKTVEF